MPARDIYTIENLRRWEEEMADVQRPIRLSVLGDPVAHSASPPMHNAALQACGIDAQYVRLHVGRADLREALGLMKERRFIGTNVTIPHKPAVLELVDEADENARRIGAVNTVVMEGGRLAGFNTDGPGLVRAIRSEFMLDLKDLRVMVLGAGGGAGRAISVQCAMEGCERLVLVNRTFEKARLLAAELAPFFASSRLIGPAARMEAVPWQEDALRYQLQHTDLVINATSGGMKRGEASVIPSFLLAPHLLVYDTIYTAPKTPLMLAAEAAGARSANGLSMLLHQGVLSFEIWFGREAPVEKMRNALLQATGLGVP